MIRGVHTMFYTSQAEELRAFLRDKLDFTNYIDAGDGWLIFNLPEADMGCHPLNSDGTPRSGTPQISFYCDDIETTVGELKSKRGGIHDRDHRCGVRPGHPFQDARRLHRRALPTALF
jgi:hypothetical protein